MNRNRQSRQQQVSARALHAAVRRGDYVVARIHAPKRVKPIRPGPARTAQILVGAVVLIATGFVLTVLAAAIMGIIRG